MLNDLLIAPARAAASAVLGTVKSLVLHVEALLGDSSNNEPMYSALGVVGRPKAPASSSSGTSLKGECEVLAVRNEDGLQPFAYRDLRLHQRLPEPAEGDVFLAGYQGGYVSIRAATGSLGDVLTVRAPRLNGSGVEQGAHSLVLDPHTSAAPAIALTHLGGYSIRITNAGDTEVRDKLVVAPDMSPQEVVLATDFNTWVGQVNAALTTLAGAAGGSVPTITAPTAVPASSSKLLAAP
jgi:hypothetical protein